METVLKSTSLVQRAYWLIKLRWVAIGTLAAAVLTANKLLEIPLPVTILYALAAGLLVYNYLLYDLVRYFTWAGRTPSHKTISRIIIFQISADLVILTVILHFSGGIENPFFLYFVFHTIMASILLTRSQSYMEATLAVFLFGLLVVFEGCGILKHYTLPWFADRQLHTNLLFVFATLWVFTTTLYLVVYMTTSISEQLRKQQEELEQANLMLQEKDHLKNEYVLRLTHDIRGHLSAIQSCLHIVEDKLVGPLNDRQMDLLERACNRAEKCMAFITALLKLTRMKLTGRLDRQSFSLKNTIFNALASIQNRAAAKAIKVEYEIDESVDEINAEPVLIEETITNLLFNAVKYTPEKGRVRLSVKQQPDSILIQVSDTGIGIPADEVDKIFDEFYRASNARQVERDGTGLGLSIVKQVVERHGGRVWAENNEQGGSTFSITLPSSPK